MFDEKFSIDIDGDGIEDFSLDLRDTNDNDNADLWMVDIDNDGETDFALLDTNDNGILDSIDLDGKSYDNDFDEDDTFDDYSDDENQEYTSPVEYEMPEIEFDFDDDSFDDGDDFESDEADDEFSEYDADNDTDEEDSDIDFDDEDDDEDDVDFDDEDNDVIDFDTYEESDDADVDYDDDDGKLYGNPDTSDDFWEYQGPTNRCAIYSQKFVIEELTGEELDIEELADLAEDNGWFAEDQGTPLADMNKILDHYGVENEMTRFNTMNDIEECLDNGGKVIVALDADEIWYDDNDDLYDGGYGVNHAVEVIGVDHTDPENPMVILNDSGTPDGQGSRIPLDVFEDAWNDGDNYMIACE